MLIAKKTQIKRIYKNEILEVVSETTIKEFLTVFKMQIKKVLMNRNEDIINN